VTALSLCCLAACWRLKAADAKASIGTARLVQAAS